MRLFSASDRIWERRLDLALPQLISLFSTGIFPGLNALILGGFLVFFLLNHQPDPGLNTADLPLPPASANTISPTSTSTPYPTSTSTQKPTASYTPTTAPTISPTPTLPLKSNINGITGYRQSMPLSCESRSAVDWAAYFGKEINEYTFFNGLPVHDNPDKGFVGDVYGSWGQIPPAPYGVHAKPIAQRLREFGLKAKAVHGMTYKELKREIASGQPVIVWVVGHVNYGTPIPYTASGGAVTTVARFEHTVIVIAYNESNITVLDGTKIYTKYKKEFLKSWNVLGNQAVIWID